jgi:hypothetical protein
MLIELNNAEVTLLEYVLYVARYEKICTPAEARIMRNIEQKMRPWERVLNELYYD